VSGLASIGAQGAGEGSLEVAQYGTNPIPQLQAASGSAFYDVSTTAGSAFSSVTFIVCGDPSQVGVEWWNPIAQSLVTASGQTADGSDCREVTITTSSTPNLSDLYGSVFVVPAVPAVTTTPAESAGGTPAESAGGTPTAPTPSPVVTVTKRARHSGSVEVRMPCTQAACSGEIRLTVVRDGKDGQVRHVVLAEASYALTAGTVEWVPLTVTKEGREIFPRSDNRRHWRTSGTVTVAGGRTARAPVFVEWKREA
jgi:hypothetical protein